MAKGYRPVLRDQQFLLPPDMAQWLPGDHPVKLLARAVEKHMDMSLERECTAQSGRCAA